MCNINQLNENSLVGKKKLSVLVIMAIVKCLSSMQSHTVVQQVAGLSHKWAIIRKEPQLCILITIYNLKQLFWLWEVKQFTSIPSSIHILVKRTVFYCNTM